MEILKSMILFLNLWRFIDKPLSEMSLGGPAAAVFLSPCSEKKTTLCYGSSDYILMDFNMTSHKCSVC